VKSSKSKGENNARHKKFKDQHPAVGPGLASAFPCLRVGKEPRQGIGVLDAMRADMGYREGKTKCSGVKGWIRRVGPCRGLHRGDWGERGDVV
jgi:hypothetical protein